MGSATKKEKVLTPEEKLNQALVPIAEQLYKIPKNWSWVRLYNLSDLFNGDRGSNYPSKKDYVETGIPFINAGAIKEGLLDSNEYNYITQEKYNTLRAGKIQKNDILYCLRGSLGKTAIVDFDGQGAISSSLCILRVKTGILVQYLYYLLVSNAIERQQIIAENGSAQPNLSAASVQKYMIPLPPLAEQHRIVSRIESLFAKLDEAKEKAQAVVDGFEDRKATILHKAFTGELTANWRLHNNPPSAFVYLKQIQDSKDCFSRNGFKFWPNDNLPNGWAESKIGNLLYFAGRIGWKGLKAEEYTDVGPYLLSVYNLNDGDEVTYHRVYHITEARYEESPEIMVQEGDVLLTKDGAGIGKLGYVKDLPQKATINSSLLLIRPANAAVPKFVYYALLGPSLQRIVKERITGSATPHLFQRDIKDFILPVPSLEEQQQIVNILDDMLAKLQRVKEAAEQVINQTNSMKESILARAFRGELGTNDPTDESAEELLKRIL